MEIYIVQPGDTLFQIAARFGISLERLISDNGLTEESGLAVGQALLILYPSVVHTVRQGESLYSIALQYQTTVLELLQNNPTLIGRPQLAPGQVLIIAFSGGKQRTAVVNGYAYPHINRQTLLRALPYLTSLTVFGYGFTEEGALIPAGDQALIDLAVAYGARPILLFSSITDSGGFSSERASLLFRNMAVQNTVIANLLAVMRQKGYVGLDIDFEYIRAEDADGFVQFVQNVTEKMHAQGYTVQVDLAPKTSASQEGLLYEGHDYARLGAIADTVLIMTYEWGYTYGPPMAVAPIGPVRSVVEYAVSVIPNEKIMLGIPNYGYDWTLPFVKGDAARVVGNEGAVRLAAERGARIEYDETAQTPYFYYWENGAQHVVWFEDARSIYAKTELISEYGLRGAGYWNLMQRFDQNWALLAYLFRIAKV